MEVGSPSEPRLRDCAEFFSDQTIESYHSFFYTRLRRAVRALDAEKAEYFYDHEDDIPPDALSPRSCDSNTHLYNGPDPDVLEKKILKMDDDFSRQVAYYHDDAYDKSLTQNDRIQNLIARADAMEKEEGEETEYSVTPASTPELTSSQQSLHTPPILPPTPDSGSTRARSSDVRIAADTKNHSPTKSTSPKFPRKRKTLDDDEPLCPPSRYTKRLRSSIHQSNIAVASTRQNFGSSRQPTKWLSTPSRKRKERHDEPSAYEGTKKLRSAVQSDTPVVTSTGRYYRASVDVENARRVETYNQSRKRKDRDDDLPQYNNTKRRPPIRKGANADYIKHTTKGSRRSRLQPLPNGIPSRDLRPITWVAPFAKRESKPNRQYGSFYYLDHQNRLLRASRRI